MSSRGHISVLLWDPDCILSVFSPQGHILVLAGFGNLRGQMEVWDVKKYKQVRKKSRERLFS